MPLLLLRPQPSAPLLAAAPAPAAGPHQRQQAVDEEAPLLAEQSEPLLPTPEQPASHPGLHLPPLRRLEGLALLLITALMWGTYAPSLRLIYSLHGPPSPAVVAAARSFLQLAALLAALLASRCRTVDHLAAANGSGAAGARSAPKPGCSGLSGSAGHDGAAAAAAAAAHEPAGPEAAAELGLEEPLLPKATPRAAEATSAASSLVPSAAAAATTAAAPVQHLPTGRGPEQAAAVVVEEGRRLRRQPDLLLGLPPAVVAALELGLYNTTGTLAQAWGLLLTTAARGAFLIQASTLFTPLLAAAAGMAPSRQTVLGSLAALAGTLVIAADRAGLQVHSPAAAWQLAAPGAAAAWGPTLSAAVAAAAAAATTPAASLLGDGLIIFAALCYSASTVRIPAWAVHRGVPSLHLALGKSAFLAAVSAAALAAQAWHLAARGCAAEQLWPGWRQSAAGWALIAWSALGPGALAAFLHVKGQTLVSPTTAQVVFCSVPLWSALLAAAVLPSEPLGPLTLLGGGLIAAGGAAAVVALPARRRDA